MMSTGQKPMHLFPFLHLIVVLTLGVSWDDFFWQQRPSREI
jgi:hypothetical protein